MEANGQHVTAVLVTHDGARWLPQVLAALGRLTRRPDQLVAVDTGSTDNSVELVTAAFGAVDVVAQPATTSFAAAVARGLTHQPPAADGWIWLLHDDCAPAPNALAALLEQAVDEDVAIIGGKAREWPSLRRLLEVGLTIGGTGRRETGLEPGEPDQGQHDEPRDVLAVGTAGMLVRTDVWQQLGGLEPALGLADDLDLGWRAARAGHRVRVAPRAVLFHAEASLRDQRTRGHLRRPARHELRRSALLVLLANCRRVVLPVQWVRLLVGSLLRAVGLLLLKAPREAWDELRAVVAVYARPLQLWRLRRARRRTARVPAAAVRHLLPPIRQPYRAGAATLVEVTAELVGSKAVAPPRAVAEPGPVAPDDQPLRAEPTPLARIRARPWAATLLVVVLLAVIAVRDLFVGGELQGGALLPAPDGIGTWWAGYLASWHPAGVGSTEPAPVSSVLLAAVGLVVLGDAGLVVSVLLLFATPLAAVTAYAFMRRFSVGSAARIWASVAYGVTPLLTGAVAQGRLGTVLATVWLPLLAASMVDLARTRTPPDRALVRWTRRARTGLALAVLVALAPVAYPIAVAAAVGWVLASALPRPTRRTVSVAVSALILASVPWVLAPWTLAEQVRDPDAWWQETGLADAGVGVLDPGPLGLLLGQPGGPGGAVLGGWLGVGVLLAAGLALLRADVRSVVVPAWCVAVLGLCAAAAGAGRIVALPSGRAEVWTGFPLVVWWGGLLVAAAAGGAHLRSRLADRSFGVSQPVVGLVVVVAVVGPAAAVGVAVLDGLDGPLRRDAATAVPAYMARDASSGARVSTLVLGGSPTGGLTATLERADGWRLGEETYARAAGTTGLSRAVRTLLVDPQPGELDVLATYGVGYLYAPAPVDPDLAAALDAAPGLVQSGAPSGDRAWAIDLPVGTISVLRGGAQVVAIDAAPDGGTPWSGTLPARGGRLRLAAAPDPGWQALVDGAELEPTVDRVTQSFRLVPGEDGRTVLIEHADGRDRWVLVQAAGVALLVLLAAPGRRRTR